MTLTSALTRLLEQDDINFTLTNRLPRRLLTRLVGGLSRARHPLVRVPSMALWQRFGGDLHLEEARDASFASLHDCFIRRLKDGARPVDGDPAALVCPCDGIVMAHGSIEEDTLVQAKGLRYSLGELLGDRAVAAAYAGGSFITIRLTSAMYHRFHAVANARITGVTFVPGDLWNVNPATVRRIPRVYCRNERAVINLHLADGSGQVALVAVGAILVGSIYIDALGRTLDQTERAPLAIPCQASVSRGQELGYFHHGSTIIVIASPAFVPVAGVQTGAAVRMGEALCRRV